MTPQFQHQEESKGLNSEEDYSSEELIIVNEENEDAFQSMRGRKGEVIFDHDNFIEEEIENEAANYFSLI